MLANYPFDLAISIVTSVALTMPAVIDFLSSAAIVVQGNIGNSAIPGWALVSTDDPDPMTELALKFLQLMGLIGVLKGSVGTMRFFSPDPHPKKPPTLAGPLFQILFGMLAMVPQTVIDIGQDALQRVGW
ncbi:hypothetical protein VRRI112168_00400 [Vreelandella rituensis]|uniref:Uncharacterized protein n=1 Tax=Vreelandella rituensis TaxID=2282306 RepID=A0A368UDI2_9GAMM|nr:hypothetical protein [Halomonas rituensis]RCV93843.1 hypothetical protein DU506_01410 [Halomonas rituensis]